MPVSEFHRHGDGYQSICKTCRAADDRIRYENDPKRHLEVREARRAKLLAWARQLKADTPCSDCGFKFHPVAMQWDHISTNKEVNVSDAVRKGFGKARILAEIAKCELVCANCHAIRTWRRREELRDIAQLG